VKDGSAKNPDINKLKKCKSELSHQTNKNKTTKQNKSNFSFHFNFNFNPTQPNSTQSKLKKSTEMSSSKRTILITGANRGIGFNLAKKLLGNNDRVIATARNPATATELRALASEDDLIIEELDVASDKSAKDLAERLNAKGLRINVLINNAGILKNETKSFNDVTSDGEYFLQTTDTRTY